MKSRAKLFHVKESELRADKDLYGFGKHDGDDLKVGITLTKPEDEKLKRNKGFHDFLSKSSFLDRKATIRQRKAVVTIG